MLWFLWLSVFIVSTLSAEQKDRPCHLAGNCTCTSLRDSDCYCDSSKEGNRTYSQCNCTELVRGECWELHTYADYGLSGECSKASSPINVILYTTSMSQEGAHAMQLFKKVMEVAYKYVDLKIIFLIEHVGYWPNLNALRGIPQIERNKLILCAYSIDSRPEIYYPYLYCLSLNATASINSTHTRGCAIEHGYEYDQIETCVEESGVELLSRDLLHSIRNIPNPTVVMDRSQMLYLNESFTTGELLDKICYVLAHPGATYSFPFWIFTLLSCAAITFVLVLWIVKKPTTPILQSLMQLFFEGAYDQQDDQAEIALRRWREGREGSGENAEEEGSQQERSRSRSRNRSDRSDESFTIEP